MVKILMLTGDAGEAQEIYYAKFRLEEEGWQVHIAIPEKRVFHSVVHDFEPGFDTYTEKAGYRVQADLGLADVAVEQYQAWFCRGDERPNTCRNRPQAVADRSPFPVDGASRSPQIATARCYCWLPASLKGRTITCYPDLEPDVRSAGAVFVNRDVVVDGSLVTVRGWPDNGPWMSEFVRLVKSGR